MKKKKYYCTICGVERTDETFYKSPKITWCKKCTSEYNKKQTKIKHRNEKIVSMLEEQYNNIYKEIAEIVDNKVN